MIVWTPNREPFASNPLAGRVAVTQIPEDPQLAEHPFSVGACDLSWREADDFGRMELMQRYFSQMLHRDFIEESEIYSALSQIEEFNEKKFSNLEPHGDDWR